MKITVGEWKTRDGCKAIVAASNAGAHPLHYWIGWIDGQNAAWTESGRFIGDEEDNDCDLVAPWIELVPWDWSTTPPWINWIAKDEEGWVMHGCEPQIENDATDVWYNEDGQYLNIPDEYAPKWSGDWRKSKTMRPGFNGGAK